jgi:CRP-like cAMP-binding protein
MFSRHATVDPKCERLASTELFSVCGGRELERLAGLCTELRLPAGKVLTRELGAGSMFFVLADGAVGITRGGNRLGELTGGSFFGGHSLAWADPCDATVVVEEPALTFVFGRSEFRAVLDCDTAAPHLIEVENERHLRPDVLLAGDRSGCRDLPRHRAAE